MAKRFLKIAIVPFSLPDGTKQPAHVTPISIQPVQAVRESETACAYQQFEKAVSVLLLRDKECLLEVFLRDSKMFQTPNHDKRFSYARASSTIYAFSHLAHS